MDVSYDFCGPIIPLGPVSFSKRADVPGVERIDFSVPAFIALEEESRYEISWNGTLIKKKTGWNDYYGFGTSPDNLMDDCCGFFEQLHGGPDVKIISTISARLCIESKDAPFYHHAQRVCWVPLNWSRNEEVAIPGPREFSVWRNGNATHGAADFLQAVRFIVGQDAAPSRNGGRGLLSVVSREKPVSQRGFMWQMANEGRHG